MSPSHSKPLAGCLCLATHQPRVLNGPSFMLCLCTCDSHTNEHFPVPPPHSLAKLDSLLSLPSLSVGALVVSSEVQWPSPWTPRLVHVPWVCSAQCGA